MKKSNIPKNNIYHGKIQFYRSERTALNAAFNQQNEEKRRRAGQARQADKIPGAEAQFFQSYKGNAGIHNKAG